ncbi:MAG TPA: HupE/UreJ family protein [Casimicrobiaceae bacterium]|jgi:hypothetical protein
MRLHALSFRLLLALCLAVPIGAARGHEFKLDAVMNVFVKEEPGRLELLVRAPLYLFKNVRFPVKNIEVDVPNAGTALERALAAIEHDLVLSEDGRRLAPESGHATLSLPSDKSFDRYDDAVRHVAQPIASDTQIYVDQGYVDAHVTYARTAPGSVVALRTRAAPELGDYLKMVVRYAPLEGDERTLLVTSQSGTVALNPTWLEAASGFIGLGMGHILTGFDHLLFLLCLVIPLRGWRPILAIVTTFTLAHSFTLIGSAFGLAPTGAWFPPFVETMIAASIVYMALENIMGVALRRRVVITALFGLVHGFGFSYGLQENLQLAGTHLLAALFAFNVGIEIGQLCVLAIMLPLLALVRRYVLRGRVGMIVLSALVAQTAWQWMTERGEALMKVRWPRPDMTDFAHAAVWAACFVLAVVALRGVTRRLSSTRGPAAAPSSAAD